MRLFWGFVAGACALAAAQDAFPGAPLYHQGWYNAAGVALLVLAALQRKREKLALFGCAAVVLAGAASGLMAPDTHTIVGAPGASVRDPDLGGTFVFPLNGTNIAFERSGSSVNVSGGRRYTGGYVLWEEPRTVVYVSAADLHGNHLTITQPTNASFLSPVLLMQQSTSIAGMNVRFDTFSVPAADRQVKAVLFSPAQAAQLRTDPPIAGKPALLFDVSDRADRQVPGGIGVAADGEQKRIGGLLLSGTAGSYPAVVVASAPYWPVLVLGIALVVTGAVRTAANGKDAA